MENIITMEKLSGEQKSLAELVGIEVYRKLVESYGGSTLYISKEDVFIQVDRDRHIKKEFDGGNYRELARKYNLSVNRVRYIIHKKKIV